jgi:hypothetical protein
MASPQSRRTPAGIGGQIACDFTLIRGGFAMTGERMGRAGFALPNRAVTVVELIAAVALVFSIVVAGTAVSIGFARANACPPQATTGMR